MAKNQTQKTALVVDDSKLARYVLKEMLIEKGIQVETAESAEEALGLLSATRPDVIFMDHMMPGMDGFQAVKAIKNDPTTANIPILMYTSKNGEMYVGQARALGAVGVLPKRLKPIQLEKVLVQLKLFNPELQKKTEPTSKDVNSTKQHKDAKPGFKNPGAAEASPNQADVTKKSNDDSKVSITTSIEEAARSAGEELEKDSMKALFRQLFLEQRDSIKQDHNQLLEHWVTELTGHKNFNQYKKRYFSGAIAAGALIGALTTYLFVQTDSSQLNENLVDTLQSQGQAIAQLQSQISALPAVEKNGEPIATIDAEILQWAINQNASIDYKDTLYNTKTYNFVNQLASQLSEANYSGTVSLRYHAGIYCEQKDSDGNEIIAKDDTPIDSCLIRFEDLNPISKRLEASATELDGFLSTLNQGNENIEFVFEPMGNQYTIVDYPDPASLKTASEWNQLAQINNRFEIVLTPSKQGNVLSQVY